LRKRRTYEILREIGAHADLEAWLRHRVLEAMGNGRIGRGRENRASALADAFFIALAGGEPEASPTFAPRSAIPLVFQCAIPFSVTIAG
jgi:hypothetical protein